MDESVKVDPLQVAKDAHLAIDILLGRYNITSDELPKLPHNIIKYLLISAYIDGKMDVMNETIQRMKKVSK